MARILVVDEDPLFLAIMSRSLEKARHDIVTATDASKAIEIFGKLKCDAVVCALVLPDSASMEFIRAVRHRTGDMAIVAVVTGKAYLPQLNPDIVRMIVAIGADDVVKKPLEVHDFVATVERTIALRKSHTQAASAAG